MINNKISTFQLGLISFIMCIAPFGFISGKELNENITDSLFSLLSAVLLCIIILLPVSLEKIHSSKSIDTLYIFYFAFLIITDVNKATKMLVSTMVYDGNAEFIIAFTLIIAVYGAKKGIEALGRSANVIFALILLGSLIIIAAALNNKKIDSFNHPFSNGYGDYLKNIVHFFSSAAYLPVIFVMRSRAKGKYILKHILFVVLAFMIIGALLLETKCFLGYYAVTQQYPLYTLASTTALEPLKRLDLFFTVIFIIASVFRHSAAFLSAFILISENCKKRSKLYKTAFMALVAGTSLVLCSFDDIIDGFILTEIKIALLLFFSAIVPIYIRIKHRKKGVKRVN